MKKKFEFGKNMKNTVAGEGNDVVNIPIEKKIWDWLNRYGRHLAIAGATLVVFWAFYLIGCAWNRHTVRKHLEDYSGKDSLQERVAWAKMKQPCALKNLQGFVFLENAQSCMEQNDFRSAIVYFNKAIEHLKISPLKEQALTGVAYAYLQDGQTDKAKEMFLELYKCKSKYLRAQALFALCSIAMQEGDKATFEKYRERLQEYDEGVGFLQKLEIFESVK